jgi:hypothetical protein
LAEGLTSSRKVEWFDLSPFYMRRPKDWAGYTRAEEAVQDGKDIGVVGRSFGAYKSSDLRGTRV